MLKTMHLYIEFISHCPIQASIIDALNSSSTEVEFHFSTREMRTFPKCKLDLLIGAYEQFASLDQIVDIASYYEEVLLIDVPVLDSIFEQLSEYTTIKMLKKPLLTNELKNHLSGYVHRMLYRAEHQLMDNILKTAQNSIVITDLEGTILYTNAYFQAISGFNQEEFLNNCPSAIKSNYHDKAFYDALWATISSGLVWEGIFINQSKSNTLFYEEATITPLRNSHGEIDRYLKIGKNITRERLLLEELSLEVQLARTVLDSLLPNPYEDAALKFDYYISHFNEIGGDFLFFNKTHEHIYHFALLDVMGHGVSSALVAITLTQMFKDYIQFKSLNDSVKAINNLLCELNSEESERNIFVTGLFIEINTNHKTMKLINSGHLDVIIRKRDESILHYGSNNLLLGVFPKIDFESYEVSTTGITRILSFTDGLFETNNVPYDTALDILDEALLHLGNERFYQGIMHSFSKNQHINDDITIAKIELNL